MGKRGTKRVLEYARLAMGFANVRAGTRVLMLVLVQAVLQVWDLCGIVGDHGQPAAGQFLEQRRDHRGAQAGPSSRKLRVPLFAARTLKATGQSRVTLSLR